MELLYYWFESLRCPVLDQIMMTLPPLAANCSS